MKARMVKGCCLTAATLVLLLPLNTDASAVPVWEIHQKNRSFSIEALTVPRNQPVLFVNDDTVPHNIMSTSAENSFDFGAQPSQTATPVSFTVAGTVVVICAIHPRMRMTITVTD